MISIWSAKKQALRKETYDRINSIFDKISELQSTAVEFYGSSERCQKQRLHIINNTEILTSLIEALPDKSFKDSLAYLVEFKDSIALNEYFDDLSIPLPEGKSQEVIQEMVLNANNLIRLLHDIFKQTFR